ncbi:uncharacterized protein H6S33_010852 [Morchella sextelata]|uniref:uncharacterized protein n=1 Tax=Morchella sextelata TaxID=1174677 RepID=UPI001D05799A|nr:uncharacterized protein H6S33_010852 [Morchella sextelata]KAH0611587.1 hypothetical protein H6S33_010852 [Morchella sextelata]
MTDRSKKTTSPRTGQNVLRWREKVAEVVAPPRPRVAESQATPAQPTDAPGGNIINNKPDIEVDHLKTQSKYRIKLSSVVESTTAISFVSGPVWNTRGYSPCASKLEYHPSDSARTENMLGHHKEGKAKRYNIDPALEDQQSQGNHDQPHTHTPEYTRENTYPFTPSTGIEDAEIHDQFKASPTAANADDDSFDGVDGEIHPSTVSSPAFRKFNADRVELEMGEVGLKDLRKVLRSGIRDAKKHRVENTPASEDEHPKGRADLKRPFSSIN